MKRITAALTTLAVIIGLGTSCQKEIESRQEISGNGTGLKVTATIADNGTKVSYQEDITTHGLKPGWEVDDIIIGFDGSDKTYGYKITDINDNGVATLTIITEGDNKGTAIADPADGTQMYMFYAPGTKPDVISSKSLTVSLATQEKGVVPAIMMAQATVANGSLSLGFSNQTAIIGVKAPTMQDKNKDYSALALSGSADFYTEVKFDLAEDNNLQASYQTKGTLTKELEFTSDETTGKGPDVIYIVACPAEQQNLSFKFNGTEEYFNVEDATIEKGNYYRLEAPNTQKQKFAITVDNTIQYGTITTSPSGSVAWGTEVTVTATPVTGYELATLTYNDGSDHDIKDAGSFTMPQKNVTVSGSFQLSTFNITATEVTEGGSYTVQSGSPLADVTTAKMGDVITVTPTPAAGYSGGTVTVKKTGTDEEVTFDATSKTFTMPAADVTITVTFKKNLPVFTVASGTKVSFAKGNLYAKKDGSAWNWGFYDKQYQFNSLSMQQISSNGGSRTAASTDTEIDLFCWGYNSTNSTNYNDQTTNSSFTDWGSISGLPEAPGATWRTLTKDEWQWLLGPSSSPNPGTNCRTSSTVNGTANARYLKCKVNDGTRGVYGLLIFPDTFTWPTTATAPDASYINKKDVAWVDVPEYNQTQFEALEGSGVVFLPAAGYRYGTSVSYVGGSGYYWSSTADGGSLAYYLFFYSSNVNPASYNTSYLGRSVRLVSVVQ